MGRIGGLLRLLDHFLAPPVCPACREALVEGPEGICPACLHSLEHLPEKRCPLCGGPLDTPLELCRECVQEPRPWTTAVCAFPYHGSAGDWLRALKYGGQLAFAPPLAREMAHAWNAYGRPRMDAQLVVPIPLHWRRIRERGFNQAGILAKELSRQLGIPYGDVLCRPRGTGHQARLKGESRRRNLRGAFALRSGRDVHGLRILVVDDVFTTGATLSDACRALLQAGAAETAVLAAARA